MGWMREIDGYCERLGPQYWAEPLNAVTNAAFLVAALIMWRRTRGSGSGLARVLVVILAAIGAGSYLFHTHARAWAAVADVVPIAMFILVYIFAVNRDIWGLQPWVSALLAALFVPYAAIAGSLLGRIPGLGGSAGYVSVALLVALYALALRDRAPATARGLAAGAAILGVSITFRILDLPLCGVWPVGTHFMWHILNAIMLGWMIEVYRRRPVLRR